MCAWYWWRRCFPKRSVATVVFMLTELVETFCAESNRVLAPVAPITQGPTLAVSKRIRPIRRLRSITTGFAAPPTVPPNNAELKVARSTDGTVIDPGTAAATQFVAVFQLASVPLSPSQVWLAAEAKLAASTEQATVMTVKGSAEKNRWRCFMGFVGYLGFLKHRTNGQFFVYPALIRLA